MALKNDRAPPLYYIKLCASYQRHRWIQIEVTVQKRPVWVEMGGLGGWLSLKFVGWLWKITRPHLLCHIKLCASFHHHMWIRTGVTIQKRLICVLTTVLLTFNIWPWPFAWTSLLTLIITPENFMMTPWWEHSENVWQTDGQTDWTIQK